MRMHLRFVAAAVWALAVSEATAHGDVAPKHGGIMNSGETSFEMVRTNDGLRFYVEDHGDFVQTKDAKASVTVTRAGVVQAWAATPEPPNIAVARGPRLQPGDKVVIRLELPDGAVVHGRYTIK